MTVINFKGFRVNESKYKRNNDFSSDNQGIKLIQDLNVKINCDETSAEINLFVSVGSSDEKNQPFSVEVDVSGFFTYNIEEDENNLGIKKLLKVNGTAILYPYVRSLVASLTNMSGEFPGYNMPTINISNYLDEKG